MPTGRGRSATQRYNPAETRKYARPRVATFDKGLVERARKCREFSNRFKIPLSATAGLIAGGLEKHVLGLENIIHLELLYRGEMPDRLNRLIEEAGKRSTENVASEAANLMKQIEGLWGESHAFLPAWKNASLDYLGEIRAHPQELINFIAAIEEARKQAR